MIEQRKKILYIAEAMGGGVFTYLVGLSNNLIQYFDITIAYATRPQTPSNYRDYFDARIKMIKVENFCREINPVKDCKAMSELKKIVKIEKPDLIHLHSSKAGVLGRILFSGKKIPVFYTPHGYSFLMKNYSSIKRNIFRIIEKLCARKNCTTISCSFGEHKETLKITQNALFVNNAIDTCRFEKNIKTGYEKCQKFTVFTIGRICEQKNPKLFNSIAEQMKDVCFVWIGDGELRSELKAENIEVTGWMDREEVINHALCADVFLLTSLWEGLPMSLLEAMYMEKLCIVSDVIGNRDVITNGVNGFICNRIEEFVSSIRLAQKGNLDDVVRNAKKDIMTKYDTKIQANAYRKIYEERV